jgi:hypothetical protein
MSTKILTPIEHTIRAIANTPRLRPGCIHWMADISVPTMVALTILGAIDQRTAVADLVKGSGASSMTIQNFARGNKADGTIWPELRDRLTAAGVQWNENARGATRRMAANKTPLDLDADIAPPRAVAPVADFAAPTKSTPLAITANGNVTTTTLPQAFPTPSAMIAKAGEFATKTDAARTVLDTKTRDILVITTKRIEYGTPEWCAKMVEINSKPKA